MEVPSGMGGVGWGTIPNATQNDLRKVTRQCPETTTFGAKKEKKKKGRKQTCTNDRLLSSVALPWKEFPGAPPPSPPPPTQPPGHRSTSIGALTFIISDLRVAVGYTNECQLVQGACINEAFLWYSPPWFGFRL